MTTMKLNITFKDYDFRRVKHMGSNPIMYVRKDWIGETICIIPMDMHTTDRYIETCKGEDGIYRLCFDVQEILCKEVKDGTSVGRCYMPKKFVGYDVLVVLAPKLEHFD